MSVFDFPVGVHFGLIVLVGGFTVRVEVVFVMVVVVVCGVVFVDDFVCVFDITVRMNLFFSVFVRGFIVGVLDEGRVVRGVVGSVLFLGHGVGVFDLPVSVLFDVLVGGFRVGVRNGRVVVVCVRAFMILF